ncbi:OCIA domain-containing protein 2 [Myxocyprinus asiaticus]|uniref:OCIA domain-containing protein 2 n=1 Tax=Myxocyprinus asiaticus TaxID=70543 RepID=UPI002221378D|nr:OCIA domain-containing protein 2 [Myxocyprinus asiaticus]XP_051511921.1 OCIA domain-containing protein 2 [Myxocyprinus asiaticus]
MTTEANQSTGKRVEDAKPSQAQWKQFQCPIADPRFPRDNLKQIWKECQNESFWYRALPLAVGSMTVTGGLMYNGVWKQSKRFGYFPKLILAGIVGYAVGKASYVGTCREKFNKLEPEFTKAFGPGFGPPGFGASGPGHRHCIHVCEKCKQQEAQAATTAPDTQS